MPGDTSLEHSQPKSKGPSLVHHRLPGMFLVERTLKYYSRGASPADRWRLVILSLALSLSWRLPILKARIPLLQDSVAGKTVVRVGESYFRLLDGDSLHVVSPDWEPWIWRYLRLPSNGVFIDVGAHIGYHTIRMAKRLKHGLVVALEPNPWTFRVLLENIRLNRLRNVIPLRVAAWSEETRLKLFVAKHCASGSSLVLKRGEGVYVNVRARRLDDIVRELGLERVDLVKVDVEGAELEVLKGMQWILKHYKPRLVAEVWHVNYGKVVEYLKSLDYTTTIIPESVAENLQYIYARHVNENR